MGQDFYFEFLIFRGEPEGDLVQKIVKKIKQEFNPTEWVMAYEDYEYLDCEDKINQKIFQELDNFVNICYGDRYVQYLYLGGYVWLITGEISHGDTTEPMQTIYFINTYVPTRYLKEMNMVSKMCPIQLVIDEYKGMLDDELIKKLYSLKLANEV